MNLLKNALRSLLRYMGYEIARVRRGALGFDPYRDIKKLLANKHEPVIFDVGANVGQSTMVLKKLFDSAQVHAFEPGAKTFEILRRNSARYRNVVVNNVGLGSRCEVQTFFETVDMVNSSFLRPDRDFVGGQSAGNGPAQIITMDEYCSRNGIKHIDVLKIDTQGFDFEVLKGAESLLRGNHIFMILMEVIFSEMYQGLPPFDMVYRYLYDRNFRLVSFYRFYHQRNLAGWTDALFMNIAAITPPA